MSWCTTLYGGWFGVVVTALVKSHYLDSWPSLAGLPSRYQSRPT